MKGKMSQDTQQLQQLINTVPPQTGVYARTIRLEAREYLFDEPVQVSKPVRIVGDNTRIILTEANITAFDVTSPNCRFEQLWMYGYSDGTNLAENGGIAFDIRGGRAIIDDCIVEHFRIGVWLHSTTEDGQHHVGNANGFIVRDSQFYWCIHGLWTRGGDANAGSVTSCTFIDCRKAITEQSFLGNYYASNLIEACPWAGDPKKAEGYGIYVPVGSEANYSTFVANYIENDSKAEVNKSCLVVGGGLSNRVTLGERIGLSSAKLVFRGDNQADLFSLGSPLVGGAIGFFQRGGDSQTYAKLDYQQDGGWAIRP